MWVRCWLRAFPLTGRFARLYFRVDSFGARFKSYYITTPIFYSNADPHIGHLYTTSLADARQRWEQMKQKRDSWDKGIIFATGNDEHGQKIYDAASRKRKEPQKFCDELAVRFKELYATCGIAYTDYIRTTEPRHKKAVQAFWKILEENGMIYKGSYEGWYSTQDETFVSEKDTKIVNGQRVTLESENKVEWTKEENYLFR